MTAGSVRAVLRLRTLAPSGLNPPQIEVIDRIQALTEDEDGPIADLDIDVWEASMGITHADTHDPGDVHELITEFEQWADEHGCTLRPAFKRRSADSAVETETEDIDNREDQDLIIPPLLCLAVYDGETIDAVYPHVDGEEVSTIHDGVEALESMATDEKQSRDERGEAEPVLI